MCSVANNATRTQATLHLSWFQNLRHLLLVMGPHITMVDVPVGVNSVVVSGLLCVVDVPFREQIMQVLT